ncbi:hypothetical protein [Streptomyces coeruleorubidus]|uniref:Uncharacterized protein n=1 Tax=Streptomyces coeruleorubidus TaxID=116188 RepID=A0A5J6I0X0_STRC4|nr:hypothetical protein [Streptomyces coeruleorubidus]QEV22797.1 hypothetical protein CP976_00320 [Streptomyces coeruleorubidus]GGU03102.1 hypothetical protein GCM10010256_73980 [Streptomyces coeruleorubidus]
MLTEVLSPDTMTLDAEVLEDLLTHPEAPVSAAPSPGPEAGIPVLVLALALAPKEPKESRRR